MKFSSPNRFFLQEKNRIQTVSLLFSFLFLVIALFGPSIPFFRSITFQTFWIDISFVVDVSKSMEAPDFLDEQGSTISRWEGTKLLIQHLLWEFPNNAYSLSVFAWEALRILPFTDDKNIFLTFLSWISSQSVVRQWTDIKKALDAWLEAFSSDSKSGALVIFSDGWEDNVDNGLQSYKEEFLKKHISLLVVWVWTQEGSFIPTGVDVFWNPVYKTYNWERVVTRVDSANLKSLASELGGNYIEIANLRDKWSLVSAILRLKWTQVMREEKGNNDRWGSFFFTFLSFCCFLLFLSLYFLPHSVWIKR